MDQLLERAAIAYMQDLIAPCPDAVWGAEDPAKLNLTETQKEEIDTAFSAAEKKKEQLWTDFRAAIKTDPSLITVDRVEALRRFTADPRLQVRQRMTPEQVKRYDDFFLSEFKPRRQPTPLRN
jgi:hypothetical protein